MTIIIDWPWQHFTRDEMQCQCGCGRATMDTAFMDRLERLRGAYGKPMRVSSGYRCAAHNLAVAHTGSTGPHTTGHAVDILITSPDAWNLVRLATCLGFTGIGVSQTGTPANHFIHLDDLRAPAYPRPWLGSY
ncbi:MAG: peptidase M15 [Magnetococcales bacterium]|nr:peptidase M15 [Magnetococcales bacterium]